MSKLLDLETIDRQIARAHKDVQRAVANLGTTKEAREAARSAVDPFERVREVAGQTAFKALREYDAGPIQSPHRDGLVRWVYELLQQRIAWELTLDEANALHEVDETLRPAAIEKGVIAKTYDEAFAMLVRAPSATAAASALDRLSDLAAPVAAVRKELRARRFEAARRLELAHPWSLGVAADAKTTIAELARTILDETDALAGSLLKEERRRAAANHAVSLPSGPALAIHFGFASDAREGWPARLGRRWLEDLFGTLAPRTPQVIVPVPEAFGGASFLRAARAWGFAIRLDGTAKSLPFALARDPYPTEAFAVGHAFALAVADRVLAKKKLGLTERTADAHARALGRVVLFEVRRQAADVLLALMPSVEGDRIEELSARVFGAPLSPALGSAWAWAGFASNPIADVLSRFAGVIKGTLLVRSFVERFDDDWFDNPRAAKHLASISAGPVWNGDVPEVDDAVRSIARANEEVLG